MAFDTRLEIFVEVRRYIVLARQHLKPLKPCG